MNMKAKFAEAIGIKEDLIFQNNKANIKTRKEPFATARFVYFKIMKDKGYSPTEIAKDTSYPRQNIHYGISRANELISINDKLAVRLFEMTKNIKL